MPFRLGLSRFVGAPHEKGKALGTRLRLRPHDTHSKGKNMSFTRKMFRILTKRILTCLFLKKGLFSILVQNSPKVTKKVLVFQKVARSCSLTKKLLKILKVAKKLPSTIWKGLLSISTNSMASGNGNMLRPVSLRHPRGMAEFSRKHKFLMHWVLRDKLSHDKLSCFPYVTASKVTISDCYAVNCKPKFNK